MRTVILVLILCFLPVYGFAQTVQENRRIEEIKRRSLKDGETQVSSIKTEKIDYGALRKEQLSAIFEKPFITLADGAVICTILMREDDNFQTDSEKIQYLSEQGILPKNLRNFSHSDQITKGEFSYMVFKAMNIRGGLMLRMIGPTKRYALKELIYLNIMPGGYAGETLSGQWAVFAFSQAIDYLNGAYE